MKLPSPYPSPIGMGKGTFCIVLCQESEFPGSFYVYG